MPHIVDKIRRFGEKSLLKARLQPPKLTQRRALLLVQEAEWGRCIIYERHAVAVLLSETRLPYTHFAL